jgi:hypothetical protein
MTFVKSFKAIAQRWKDLKGKNTRACFVSDEEKSFIGLTPGECVQDDQAEADDAVAAQGGQHSFEVGPVDVRLQLESHDCEVANVIGAEG